MAEGTKYVVGQLVRLTANYTDTGNAPIDPSSITLTIEVADGSTDIVVSTTGLTNPTVGTFYYDYDASSTGLTEHRWVSASPQTADQSWFVVEASRTS